MLFKMFIDSNVSNFADRHAYNSLSGTEINKPGSKEN